MVLRRSQIIGLTTSRTRLMGCLLNATDMLIRLANRNYQRIAAMSITRNNHYVPQWYQEGFFEPGRSSLAYVDLSPDRKVLADGRVIVQRGAWDETPTSMAFRQKDLYSTFFGTSVNDEIERRLFGDVDGRGSEAVG